MGDKDTYFSINKRLNVKGKFNSMEMPLIQGILNITSDSFYDGGKYSNLNAAMANVHKMVQEGVDIIDVGGQSTRPGAKRISALEEIKVVIPVIKEIVKSYPDLLISIDTFYSDVAQTAVSEGASIVNDVFGGRADEKMFDAVAKLKVPYILTHSRGDSSTMRLDTDYKDLIGEMMLYFEKKIKELNDLGVEDIIIDPGFGFAKTLDQNYEIMKRLDVFIKLKYPVLVGVSRKSMIYNLLEKTADKVLNGTTVLNTFAITKGASIIRVHDVVEAKEVTKLLKKLI